jgi:hypothetical protein
MSSQISGTTMKTYESSVADGQELDTECEGLQQSIKDKEDTINNIKRITAQEYEEATNLNKDVERLDKQAGLKQMNRVLMLSALLLIDDEEEILQTVCVPRALRMDTELK